MNKLEAINIDKKPIKVKHSELKRTDDSSFRSACPRCFEGTLLVQRDFDSFEIKADDYCILCGQKFIYSDIDEMREPERIEGEKHVKEMKDLINGLITYWENDTINLSSIETKHLAFALVKHIAEKPWYKELVITTILERIKKEPTWFHVVLRKIVPKKEQPVLPDKYRGKREGIYKMTNRKSQNEAIKNIIT